MRLNTILTTFVVVSITALTTGCAAKFGEPTADDTELTKSGTLDDNAAAAKTGVDERQTQAVDTHAIDGKTGFDRNVVSYDHVIVPAEGRSNISDKVQQVDKDEQLKRSFSGAFAQQAHENSVDDAQTSVDGH